MPFQQNISLLPFNTFGIDVKAKYFAEYENVTQLQKLLSHKLTKKERLLHIGQGSNLLFTDDFDGIILHSNIKTFEILEENEEELKIKVGAGVVWDDFVSYCVKNGLQGAENLSLIPGEVGASAVQNIGAYGTEVKDIIEEVETLEIATKQTKTFLNKDCKYGYRSSVFKKELKGKLIVTHVVFKLSKNTKNIALHYNNLREEVEKLGKITLENIRNTVVRIREKKLPDPKKLGNAGSFFMNPIIKKEQFQTLHSAHPTLPHYLMDNGKIKIPAGWLIDQAGLKGKRFGEVGIHNKQALVIVNYGKATGKEIQELAKLIQGTIKKKFGINIQPEVNEIGNENS